MITGRISKAAIQAKAQVIDSNSDWFLSTGERRSALKTQPIWHTILKVATLAEQRTQSVRRAKSVDLRLQHPRPKERKAFAPERMLT
jgi:predicted secreted protein